MKETYTILTVDGQIFHKCEHDKQFTECEFCETNGGFKAAIKYKRERERYGSSNKEGILRRWLELYGLELYDNLSLQDPRFSKVCGVEPISEDDWKELNRQYQAYMAQKGF